MSSIALPQPTPPTTSKCPLPPFPNPFPTLDTDDLLSRKSSKPVAWVIAHYYGNQFGASVWIPILKCNYAKMCTYASDLLKRNLFPIGKKMFPVLDKSGGGIFIFFSVRLKYTFQLSLHCVRKTACWFFPHHFCFNLRCSLSQTLLSWDLSLIAQQMLSPWQHCLAPIGGIRKWG